MDVKAHVEAALARIMAAASSPTAEAMEEDVQSGERSKVGEADEEDEGLEIVGVREAHEVEQRETEVADRAGPKTGEVHALGQGVVHAGGSMPLRTPSTAGAARSTPGSAPDPPGHCPRGAAYPAPFPAPRDADA